MERRFTSSPWGFRLWDFERYCDFMKKIGITDICVQFGNPEEFPLSFKADRDEIKRYKEIADSKEIKIIETETGNYRDEIPLAKELGIKYLRVCNHWQDSDESFKNVVRMLKDTGKVAEEYNMTVIVENHGGLMTKAEKCRKLIEAVGMENVKINYDPANFLYFGEDPIKAIDEILPYIGFTHFKSVKYEDGKPKYCRLKEGVIDYKKIFERLFGNNSSPLRGDGKGEMVYTGYIGLEYEEPSDVEEGTLDDFEYIKNLL